MGVPVEKRFIVKLQIFQVQFETTVNSNFHIFTTKGNPVKNVTWKLHVKNQRQFGPNPHQIP